MSRLWPRHCALSAFYGAAFGAWVALWVFATVRGAQAGWGMVALSERQGRDIFPLEIVLDRALAYLGLGHFPGFAWLTLLLVVAGALAGALIASVGQLLAVDPQRHSRTAIIDLLRRPRALLLWQLPGILAVVISYLARDVFPALLALPWMVTLTLPFVMANRTTLEGPAPKTFHFWQPGWRALALFFSVLVAGIVIELLIGLATAVGEIGGSAMAGVAFQVLGESINIVSGVVLTVLASAAWFGRVDFSRMRRDWRHFLSRSTLGAYLALEVRFFAVFGWIVPPVLAAAVTMVYIVPQLEELMHSLGPSELPWIVRELRWLSANWWLVLPPLLTPWSEAANGRLYFLLFPSRDADKAANRCGKAMVEPRRLRRISTL